ncbi:MAG: Crp/Fnr family transcriptional regulator [Bacteroidetes bacterium]|nr:Crp/Fnr family transcriptional regulator [Bacteroidota bacterium]
MDIDNLILCPICGNIPVNERDDFLNELKFKAKYFKKGEWIAQQGDIVKALYILLKGSVKAEMISDAGTVLNIETINAPNPLAPAFLFAENNHFPVDVVALEDCEIIVISKESIMKQLACNEMFLQGFMKFNSNRAHFLSERLKFLSTKTIKGKLAKYILARTENMDFSLDMSQTALAEYFGVARPSLSRSLSEMIDDEIITLKGKNGKVLNFTKLRRLVTNG